MGTKIVTNCIYNDARHGRKIQKHFKYSIELNLAKSFQRHPKVSFQFSTDDHVVTEKYKNTLLLFRITPLLS